MSSSSSGQDRSSGRSAAGRCCRSHSRSSARCSACCWRRCAARSRPSCSVAPPAVASPPTPASAAPACWRRGHARGSRLVVLDAGLGCLPVLRTRRRPHRRRRRIPVSSFSAERPDAGARDFSRRGTVSVTLAALSPALGLVCFAVRPWLGLLVSPARVARLPDGGPHRDTLAARAGAHLRSMSAPTARSKRRSPARARRQRGRSA